MEKIKSKYFIVTLSLVLFLISGASFGQTRSSRIETINGKKYYIHKVEKGQSLYAIAKTYEMDVNSILAENDEAIDGLKQGQELKIPFETLLPKQSLAIDTTKFVYHKIAKGETIFGLSKKYGIDEKKLASYNPSLHSGLKEGEYLVVGEKKKTVVKSTATQTVAPSVFYETYTIQQGETLYGISKKLKISQENLIKLNPELKDGTRQGQVIRTAVKPSPIANLPTVVSSETVSSNVAIDSTLLHKPKKAQYNIGLFLPFKLSETDNINIDDLAKSKSAFPQTQSLALDFYAGFKKAVDSLNTKDFELNIHVFDVEDRDSSKIEAMCKTSEFKTLDVIFGPLYAYVFKLVSNRAKLYGIPVVSPLTQQNKILFNNPLVSKVNPSQFTLIESLADYCVDSLVANSKIIIVNSITKDHQYVKAFKERFHEMLLKNGKSATDSVMEVKGIAGVKNAYMPGKKNVVVLFTNNPVFLQDFITQLYVFSEKKEIVLMGFNSVANIDNLDQDYLNALQFHFASSDKINVKDSVYIAFTKEYQNFYTADPSEYYFQGFDIAMYYLLNLKSQGPESFLNLDKNRWEGLSTGFKFYQPDEETGFENRAVYIYRYSDYQLQKLGWK
jgi:LysM repeat protein/ABC-type branched-subunit amino acid transport system substrate-binding protein